MTRNEWLENFETYRAADAALNKTNAALSALEDTAGTDDMDDAAFDAFLETGEAKGLLAEIDLHSRQRTQLLKRLYSTAFEFIPGGIMPNDAASQNRIVIMEKVIDLVAKGLAA